MVTPSAPRLGSVEPSYIYPKFRDSDIDLLNKSERYELYTATDELLSGQGSLRKFQMNFCYGTVLLTFESHIHHEFYGTMLLDMLATKFFNEHKEDIAKLNPPLYNYIESNILTREVRKISDLFYKGFSRYLEDQTTDEDGLDELVERSTIKILKPGFKKFHTYCHSNDEQVTSFNILTGKAGEEFKKFLQKKVPMSLLSHKHSDKTTLCLQSALDQKSSYSEKLLYLKQVLFLLVFQDVFKDSLLHLKQSLNMEKDNLYRSSNRSHDLYSHSQYIQSRIELIDKTLAKLPINDVLALVPLACRSSLEELNQDRYYRNCYIKEESLARECGKARQADIVITNLLEKGFGKTLKSFSEDGVRSIESYLMGLSGLAISSGVLGRLAMNDHHKVYYQRDALCSIPNVSDNLPLEFLVTAAQFYPANSDNWIEETHLGYIKEMLGAISTHEIEGLKYKIQKVRKTVNKAPVEKLLQGCSLKNSAMAKLQSLYKKTREEVGLVPLPDNSSCSII